MNSNYLTFDYQSGSMRRDLLREANEVPTQIVKANNRESGFGIFGFIRQLFGAS